MRVFAVPAVIVSLIPLFAAPASAAPRPALPGDFNGDGRTDLAVGVPELNGASGGVVVRLGGRRGLGRPVTLTRATPGVPGGRTANERLGEVLVSGDFDGDGYADLALGSPAARQVLVLRGSKRGPTGRGAHTVAGGTGFGRALAVGDFDGDGRSDLAVTARAGIRVAAGGPSGLSRARSYGLTAGRFFGYATAAGDVTGDGIADLVALRNAEPAGDDAPDPAGLQKARLYVLPGGRHRRLSVRSAWSARLPDDGFRERRLAVGDMDGDGRADVATVRQVRDRGRTELWRSRGRSLAAPARLGDGDWRIALADVTGDRRADLVSIHHPDPADAHVVRVRIVPGGPRGPRPGAAWSLRSPALSAPQVFSYALSLLDVVGDRRKDVLIGLPEQDASGSLLLLSGDRLKTRRTLEGPAKSGFGGAIAQLSGTSG